MENVSVSPSGSVAVGVKSYWLFTLIWPGGVPDIVGGALFAITVIENAGRLADSAPSLTVITMPL